MILYHGTNVDFGTIDITKSKPNKDFGQGFYLTQNYSQAMEMGKLKAMQTNVGSARVLTYEFDEDKLTDGSLKVLRFDGYSSEWANFILKNRNGKPYEPQHDYDIVIGPIADDRVGFQLRRYEVGIIDMKLLIENLKYMKGITIQYFFGTHKALENLKRI